MRERLEILIVYALTMANQAKFDVFNALTLMVNASFLHGLEASIFVTIPISEYLAFVICFVWVMRRLTFISSIEEHSLFQL